jgi:uncharacterized protein
LNRGERSELRRRRDRGSYDADAIFTILDSGFLAHVAFSVANQTFVIPTLYGRQGSTLYLHGSVASRLLLELERGISICVAVTLVDGLVLSRSAFDHSMNYRSVVAFGHAQKIEDSEEKLASLRIISEHLIAGRWSEVRPPSGKELNSTTVLRFSIEEASSKTRHGPPEDDESDRAIPVWAGVLPLELGAGIPVPDEPLCAGVAVPDYMIHCGARLRGKRLK